MHMHALGKLGLKGWQRPLCCICHDADTLFSFFLLLPSPLVKVAVPVSGTMQKPPSLVPRRAENRVRACTASRTTFLPGWWRVELKTPVKSRRQGQSREVSTRQPTPKRLYSRNAKPRKEIHHASEKLGG